MTLFLDSGLHYTTKSVSLILISFRYISLIIGSTYRKGAIFKRTVGMSTGHFLHSFSISITQDSGSYMYSISSKPMVKWLPSIHCYMYFLAFHGSDFIGLGKGANRS